MQPPTIGKGLGTQPQQQAFGSGPAVPLPGAMAGRGSGEREGAGEKYGEKPASEEAVLRALRWLQSQQQTDGSWGSNGVKPSNGVGALAKLFWMGRVDRSVCQALKNIRSKDLAYHLSGLFAARRSLSQYIKFARFSFANIFGQKVWFGLVGS